MQREGGGSLLEPMFGVTGKSPYHTIRPWQSSLRRRYCL